MKRWFPILPVILCFSCATLAAAPDGEFERTLTVTGPVELEVKNDSGRVIVVPGEPGTVRIHAEIRRNRNWLHRAGMEQVREVEANPPIEQAGNKVRVGIGVRGHTQRGLSIRYEIEVPRETALRVNSDSGGIEVEGIWGPVEAEADSGEVKLTDIGGSVNVECDSGRIEADGIDGEFIASADSGGIHAMNVAGRIDAETDSGGINVSQVAAADIRAQADSGGVRVRIPEGAGYDVTASTDSGGIEVQMDMTVRGEIKRNRLEGKIHGGGHRMHLESDSGGIHITEGPAE